MLPSHRKRKRRKKAGKEREGEEIFRIVKTGGGEKTVPALKKYFTRPCGGWGRFPGGEGGVQKKRSPSNQPNAGGCSSPRAEKRLYQGGGGEFEGHSFAFSTTEGDVPSRNMSMKKRGHLPRGGGVSLGEEREATNSTLGRSPDIVPMESRGNEGDPGIPVGSGLFGRVRTSLTCP